MAKCNSKPSLPKCIVCNSTEDINCANPTDTRNIQVCEKYKNQCFTLVTKVDIKRGCLDDMDWSIKANCDMNDGRCDICETTKGPGCNDLKLNTEKCIECWSSVNPRCRTHPEILNDKICDKFQPIRRSGCYLKIVSIFSIFCSL